MILKRDPYSKAIKKYAKKYGTIKIYNDSIRGEIKIIYLREYEGCVVPKVGIQFRGKLHSRFNQGAWYEYKDLGRLSKIRTNRFIKERIFKEVSNFFRIFDICLYRSDSIKTVKWVE